MKTLTERHSSIGRWAQRGSSGSTVTEVLFGQFFEYSSQCIVFENHAIGLNAEDADSVTRTFCSQWSREVSQGLFTEDDGPCGSGIRNASRVAMGRISEHDDAHAPVTSLG